MTNNVRLIGFLKLLGGALVFTVILFYFMRNGLEPGNRPFAIILPALPGAFALGGIVELTTGMRVTEVASAWDALAGWQRGVLGVLIVVLAFALMMVGVILFA